MKTAIGSTLAFIKISMLPNSDLLGWLLIAIVLDFLTGISKAIVLKQQRTSTGLRKTVVKLLQYCGALAALIILSNISKEKGNPQLQTILEYANDGLLVFIIYIEIVSIFENLNEIDKTSVIAKYVYKPILRILTLALKNNPINTTENEATK